MNEFLNVLIQNIVANRLLPKIQVERQISPIFEIFIENLINHLAVDKKISKGEYRFIASEFPLKTEGEECETLRSSNIDFLLLNKTLNTLLFVELKTDSSSFDLNQYNRYSTVINEVKQNSASALYNFLCTLNNLKYRYYKEMVVDQNIPVNKWQEIRLAEILYIAPNRIRNRQWGAIIRDVINAVPLISFSNLPEQIEHKFSEEWKLIRKELLLLDEN